MAELTIEEIKKLPPRIRIERLREFEAEQKKKREEEEKKSKQEEEEIIRKSIDEIAKEERDIEEEEEKSKEKKKPEESLEEIAEEAKPLVRDQGAQPYRTNISEYARRPATELLSDLRELDERGERGYFTKQEQYMFQNRAEAIQNKEQSGYKANQQAMFAMSEAEKIIERNKNKLSTTMNYN